MKTAYEFCLQAFDEYENVDAVATSIMAYCNQFAPHVPYCPSATYDTAFPQNWFLSTPVGFKLFCTPGLIDPEAKKDPWLSAASSDVGRFVYRAWLVNDIQDKLEETIRDFFVKTFWDPVWAPFKEDLDYSIKKGFGVDLTQPCFFGLLRTLATAPYQPFRGYCLELPRKIREYRSALEDWLFPVLFNDGTPCDASFYSATLSPQVEQWNPSEEDLQAPSLN